jgi:hypothetical protein
MLSIYGEGFLAPHPIIKLEYRPLLAVSDNLFNIISATLLIWRPSLQSSEA